MTTTIEVLNFKHAIEEARSKYTPDKLTEIDSIIRDLAKNHYLYGAKMPLVIGKARGIQGVLNVHYGVNVSIFYIWHILTNFANEPQE